MTGATYLLAALLAGALATTPLGVRIRLEEQVAIAIVVGLCGSAVVTALLGLPWGVNTWTIFGGPLVLAAAGWLLARHSGVRATWRETLVDARHRWRSGLQLKMFCLVELAAVVGFAVAFRHALFSTPLGITAGFGTVAGDWSMHATMATSFAYGANVHLPPQDPLLAGTPLYYPWMPDMQAGALTQLGWPLTAALPVPLVLLCSAVIALMMQIGVRLAGSLLVGVLAAALCLLGGGVEFTGAYWDACAASGHTAKQCDPAHLLLSPGDAAAVTTSVVRSLPGVVTNPPRSYDGFSVLQDRSAGNVEWGDPLVEWWLPQRAFVYGIAIVVAALLLVSVALSRAGPSWSLFGSAGALVGVLPWFHAQSFIVMVLTLPLLALLFRRREWLLTAGVGLVIVAPRLVQLLGAPHGAHTGVFGDSLYPWLYSGWEVNEVPPFHDPVTPLGLAKASVSTARQAFTPGFWHFWITNTGVMLPVSVGAVGVGVVRWWRRHRRSDASRTAYRPGAWLNLRFWLPFLAVFPIANVVVFQTDAWDNTKVLLYWYLGAAFILSSGVARCMHRGRWLRVGGVAIFASAILGCSLTVVQTLPWTNSARSVATGVAWATRDDERLAAEVRARTAPDALFLTGGRVNDPVLTMAGRRTVLGFGWWPWVHGLDTARRARDVAELYRGCPTSQPVCPTVNLLHTYGIDYVELGPTEIKNLGANVGWWTAEFPTTITVGDTRIFDTRASGSVRRQAGRVGVQEFALLP